MKPFAGHGVMWNWAESRGIKYPFCVLIGRKRSTRHSVYWTGNSHYTGKPERIDFPEVTTPETVEYGLAQTAKEIRAVLKAAFPDTTFSVRSKSYSGGSSIDVHWDDGPRANEVEPLVSGFNGSGFDGMQDLKYSLEPVMYKGRVSRFRTDYVFCHRSISYEAWRAAADALQDKFFGETGIEISKPGDWVRVDAPNIRVRYVWMSHCHEGERFASAAEVVGRLAFDRHDGCYLRDLLRNVAYAVSYCGPAADVETPARLTQESIDAEVMGVL